MNHARTRLQDIFAESVTVKENLVVRQTISEHGRQNQTTDVFSEKWEKAVATNVMDEKGIAFQKNWYLSLYGFESEEALAAFLQTKPVIMDAGCGLGYKAAWFAELAPGSLVVAMDFSDAADIAANKYRHIKNLYFVKGDIANTGFKEKSIDYVSCDQVIHHTEFPEQTFAHLAERITDQGEFGCYVYARKALPRELIDDFFRDNVSQYTSDQIWELSTQLTELGRTLSNLRISFECPNIPLLNIKGGTYDIQRFIYWNFLKIFWNDELGYEYSLSTNFDWFAPSNAYRYSEEEFKKIISDNDLKIIHFHSEEACYSGRFGKSFIS